MFDCVMPTRNARNGWLFTRYGDIKIKNAVPPRGTPACSTKAATATPAATSAAPTCTTCTAPEILGSMLNTVHNLRYYQTQHGRNPRGDRGRRFAPYVARFRGAAPRHRAASPSGGEHPARPTTAILHRFSNRHPEFQRADFQCLRPGRRRRGPTGGLMDLLPLIPDVRGAVVPDDPPQMKRAKEHKAMVRRFAKVTKSSLAGAGRSSQVGDSFVQIEVAPNTVVAAHNRPSPPVLPGARSDRSARWRAA